jgi:hypothetical protein
METLNTTVHPLHRITRETTSITTHSTCVLWAARVMIQSNCAESLRLKPTLRAALPSLIFTHDPVSIPGLIQLRLLLVRKQLQH